MTKYGNRIIEKKQYVMMKQLQNMRKYMAVQSEDNELTHCISSAIIYDLADIPKDVVGLYSKVSVSSDGGWSKEFQLVLPSEVLSREGVLSLDSALGAAVMGLSEGDCADYRLMGGNTVIKIERVLQFHGVSTTSLKKHFFDDSVNKLV